MAQHIRSLHKFSQIFPELSSKEISRGYLDNRENFKTGDLVFFSGYHWLSSIIRWRSKSPWSHVGMVIKIDEIDRLFLAESVIESGVRLVPLSNIMEDYAGDFKPYNGRIVWARHADIALNEESQRKLKTFCLDNLNKQYDRFEYWRILWRSFVGREKFFRDTKYTCAEFLYEAYIFAGIHLPKEKGLFISPGVFWRQSKVALISLLK